MPPFHFTEALHRHREGPESVLPIRLVSCNRRFKFGDQSAALDVLALELVERLVECVCPRAELAEQIGVFLRVMKRLGKTP